MRELSPSEIDTHVSNLAEQGFTIVEDAIPAAVRQELSAALEEVQAAHNIGYRDTAFEGTRTVRIYNLLAYHSAFEQIPVSPLTLPIVERILDEELQLSDDITELPDID